MFDDMYVIKPIIIDVMIYIIPISL